MKCIDPKMKKLVGLYQFNLLPEEEKTSVEAHLLECEACFDELYRLSPVLEILQEMPERFLDALQPGETFFARILKFLKRQVDALKRTTDSIPSAITAWWQKPAIKILVPAAAAIAVAIILLVPSAEQYSDLAILKKASYEAPDFRGPIELSPAQKLFAEGMKLYEQDEYAGAIAKLAAYLEREPENAYGHFYLGVSLLLEDEFDSGIEHLKSASGLCREQNIESLLEKCFWYLGNAYLKIDDGENALIEFRKIIELQGELEERARMQVRKIEEIKKKKDNK